jgi:hypothetical protein
MFRGVIVLKLLRFLMKKILVFPFETKSSTKYQLNISFLSQQQQQQQKTPHLRYKVQSVNDVGNNRWLF